MVLSSGLQGALRRCWRAFVLFSHWLLLFLICLVLSSSTNGEGFRVPPLGPGHSCLVILFPYCCSAQGFQFSPSRENAWAPCQSPVQRPHLLVSMARVVFQVSEIGPGFEPVYMRGPQISEAPRGAVVAADMDCPSVDLTQR